MGRRSGGRGIDGRPEPDLPRARARRLRGGRLRARARRERGRRARGRGRHGVLRPPAPRRAREDAMTREPLRPVLYDEAKDVVRLLDQKLLPAEERWLELASSAEVVSAIK